ncbi:hypothetical protein KKF84_20810 [Myxococcota bacterium]|nr:hypothetical protein [Myxococcota bacterium]MBU1537766.1 hypothetical protein [Myxococcota bacterium]
MADQQAYVLDGRFALGALVERVAIGDYYNATDTQTNAPVILFITHPTVLPDAPRLEKARTEIEAVSKASVSGIDPLIYCNTLPDGRLFTVRKGQKSAPLASRISQGTVNYLESVQLLGSLIKSLQQAAAVGVFHREIGPNNVIFLNENTLGIKNFGLAQPLGNNLFGDPWFMAPEQAVGQEPGMGSTIYSLACIYYYMVVVLPPFQDADPAVLYQRHRQEMPVAPSKARPDVIIPEAIDGVILKAMAKEPGARYPNLSSFISDLNGAINPAHGDSSIAATVASDPVVIPQEAPPAQVALPVQTAPAPQQVVSTPAVQQSAPVMTPLASSPATDGQEDQMDGAEGEDDQPRSPRRRKRGGFRETLWFKKGEEARVEEPAKAEDMLKVEKGTGTLSDKNKSIEERYRDGTENLSADDRRKFSVRTGQTGVFQAVKVEDIKAAEAKREVVETEMAQQRKKSKLLWGIIALVIIASATVGGIFAANTILYKEKFSAKGIEEMEALLISVKPAPKPQFLFSSSKDFADLLKKAKEALKNRNIVPSTKQGTGESAAEFIISMIKLKDTAHAALLESVKSEFTNYALSMEVAAKHHDNMDMLIRLSSALEIINPNNQVSSTFRLLVQFYQTKKGQRFAKKTPIKFYLDMLPFYPQLPNWDYVSREKLQAWMKENKRRGNVKKDEAFALMLHNRLVQDFLKKSDDSVINPYNDCGMCTFVTLEKTIKELSTGKKLRNRKLIKIQADLPKIKKQVLDQLHKLLTNYVDKKDFRMVKRTIYAISRFFSTTDKIAMEVMAKVQKFLPPDSLAKVSKDFVAPK